MSENEDERSNVHNNTHKSPDSLHDTEDDERSPRIVVTAAQHAFLGDIVDLEEAIPAKEGYKRAEFWIDGMTCTVCTGIIEQSIRRAVPEVHTIAISLATDTANITWPEQNDATVLTLQVRNAIEAVGYSVQKVVLAKETLSSSSLQPNDKDGDEDVNGNIESGGDNDNDNHRHHQEQPVSTPGMDDMEERWRLLQNRQKEKVQGRRRAFFWSLLGTVPILMMTMFIPQHFFPILHRKIIIHHHFTMEVEALLLWILATPVQFISGWEFYRGAFFAMCIAGRAGMDVLIALGTTASYFYAVVGVLTGDTMAAHFFETSAVLICFVLGGKWMQALAVRRTSQALTQLLELQAKTAIQVTPISDSSVTCFDPARDPYQEETVPIQNIHTGDIVKVLQGTSIPADGRVLAGEMSVDESMVTGEAMPVLKTLGSSVLGGTVCVETGNTNSDGQTNNMGASFCQVTGVGTQTALAQIVQLVHDAQTRTVPIQTFADSISALFVPVVCSISVLTFLVWYALCSTHVVPASWYAEETDPMTFSILFAIACLVISCPCALGLATPTAVMVGTGVSAKVGILLKGGESLEIASTVDSVIFDKTGTLTKGKPAVSDFLQLDEKGQANENQILWLLASLERSLEHPLAKAIVKFAEEKLGEDNIEDEPFEQPSDFRSFTGRGALGRFGTTWIAVGNRAFAEMHNYDVTFVADECMQSLEEEGKTAVLIAINGIVKAILGIVDEIKEDAGPAITYLRSEMGIDVWMVTGDNSTTAAAVGRKLDIPENRIIAEALPATKLEHVRKLQAEGKVVAMVGDGINDSPALAQADVGLSLGTGAAIANEASDIVLVKGHVVDVCTALDLSRTIFKRIQWNFVWSLIYNCLGIPVAAGVFYPLVRVRLPPTVAALAMALSSVSVVMSSLTLRWYQPPSIASSSSRQPNRRYRRRRRERLVVAMGHENDSHHATMSEPLLIDHDCTEFTESTEPADNRTTRRSL